MRHYIDPGKLNEFCSRFGIRAHQLRRHRTPDYTAAQHWGYGDSADYDIRAHHMNHVEEDLVSLELTSRNLEEIINTVNDFYSHLNGDKFRGTEGRDIYRHYLERDSREQLLRDNNPTLKNLWDQYQAVRALVLSNREHK